MATESEKYLTEDILIDVFLRLQVKSLVRCTSVCKTWHHIIHSTSFASTHLSYQKTSASTRNNVLSILNYTTLPNYSRERYYGCQLKIHGMCDGLLCISNSGISDEGFTYFNSEYRVGDNLHLWNPICRKAKKLPQLRISEEYDEFVRKGGVSFGHYDNDYKVIVISTVGNVYDVSVYSLSTNCWKIIHTNIYYEDKIVDFCTLPEPTKFVDGIAYLITDTFRMAPSSNIIPPLAVCFDLKDETIQQFKCPEEFIQYGTQFAMEAYGETVAVLGCNDDCGYLDMWILFRDNFSFKSRWEKKLFIELQEVGFSIPVGFLYNGKYLVKTTVFQGYQQISNFFLYDLESLEVTAYRSSEDLPDYDCIINSDCVESLLLLQEDSIDPYVNKEMESSRSSLLFTLHNYLEKTSPKKVKSLYDNGSAHGPEILELTEDDIAVKFASGLEDVVSVSLSISYPSIAAAPSMFNNAYKNVLALSVATGYRFKQAEEVEEFLKLGESNHPQHQKF